MAIRGAKPVTARKATKRPVQTVRCWQDDPGSPDRGVQPVEAAVPDLARGTLPTTIVTDGPAPPAGLYEPGTAEFRHWAAAEALQRSTTLWSSLLPKGVTWYPSNGKRLPVALDDGEDLNAYYDRNGLHFFHASVGGRPVFSGESPDVCSHELGHAILDALRPQLWDASFIEAGAFHESFGDMSALLVGLQLPSLRDLVLTETSGHLYRTSRLSRMAEQLGWAIRQLRPEVVEPDCLRNAVNVLFYRDPTTLPPSGPAATLSSEPHSFSRVFTGGFLEALAGIHALQARLDSPGLQQASLDAGALLIDAITASPLVPSYYSQIAAHMIEADANRFQGRYTQALKGAFVKHGILSLGSANAVAASPQGAPVVRARAVTGGGELRPLVPLGGGRYGLGEDLLVPALAETKRFSVVGSGPDVDGAASPSPDEAARSLVEDLFRRDKVDVTAVAGGRGPDSRPVSHLSHAVVREGDALVLVRRSVDCGFDVFR